MLVRDVFSIWLREIMLNDSLAKSGYTRNHDPRDVSALYSTRSALPSWLAAVVNVGKDNHPADRAAVHIAARFSMPPALPLPVISGLVQTPLWLRRDRLP